MLRVLRYARLPLFIYRRVIIFTVWYYWCDVSWPSALELPMLHGSYDKLVNSDVEK
jgi:hypothetical protein